MRDSGRNPFQIQGPFHLKWGSLFVFWASLALLGGACSITAVRPAQEMSNMEVAIRAAREVNADVLAPELFRMAQETALKARQDYRFKNFQAAKSLADQARGYAERAEFESVRNGGKREGVPEDPLANPSYPVEPIDPNAKPAPPEASPSPQNTGAAP